MTKIDFKTYYLLMQVKNITECSNGNITECSNGSILQYSRPSLSYHLSASRFKAHWRHEPELSQVVGDYTGKIDRNQHNSIGGKIQVHTGASVFII